MTKAPWECPRCHKINNANLMQCFCKPRATVKAVSLDEEWSEENYPNGIGKPDETKEIDDSIYDWVEFSSSALYGGGKMDD